MALRSHRSYDNRFLSYSCINLASHDIYCRLRRLRVTSGGWKSLQWVMNIKVLHYTYGMGSLLFKSIFSYLCYWLYMNANPFTYTYCHLYFYHWNWRYVSQLYKNTCKNGGFLEYVTNACNSWYFNEKCTPRESSNPTWFHGRITAVYTAILL